MSFEIVPKSVTLNDLKRRNGPYFAFFPPNSAASGAHCVKVVQGKLKLKLKPCWKKQSSCVLLKNRDAGSAALAATASSL